MAMARAHTTAIAAIALLGTCTILPGAANAAPVDAPFGCDAPKGTTCFFKLFLGPRATRVVQLLPGMKVSIPGINIGQDSYCASLNKAPLAKCERTAINATYNH
jgi:hypothetical protein